MFKIGQKVVCVDVGGKYKTHLIKNKIYIVQGISVAPCCSIPIIDIGNSNLITICQKCSHEFSGSWKDATRFRPLQEEKGTTFIENFIEIKETNKITFYN